MTQPRVYSMCLAEISKSHFPQGRRVKILTAVVVRNAVFGESKSCYFMTNTSVKFLDNTFHITGYTWITAIELGFPFYLGGVMVSTLAVRPKVCGYKPSQGNGFLSVIKNCSTPSFRGEVKPSYTCCKILRHVKKLWVWKRDFVDKIHNFLHQMFICY
jgi:hypothetical protein